MSGLIVHSEELRVDSRNNRFRYSNRVWDSQHVQYALHCLSTLTGCKCASGCGFDESSDPRIRKFSLGCFVTISRAIKQRIPGADRNVLIDPLVDLVFSLLIFSFVHVAECQIAGSA